MSKTTNNPTVIVVDNETGNIEELEDKIIEVEENALDKDEEIKEDLIEEIQEVKEDIPEIVDEKVDDVKEEMKSWLVDLVKPIAELIPQLSTLTMNLNQRVETMENNLASLTPPPLEESPTTDLNETNREISLSEPVENPVESVEEKLEEVSEEITAPVEKLTREIHKI